MAAAASAAVEEERRRRGGSGIPHWPAQGVVEQGPIILEQAIMASPGCSRIRPCIWTSNTGQLRKF